ncbi:MAG: amino acid permease [Aerococcus sp.]|nr:amino acid permease [Aerococcus sp.]
MDTKHLRWYNLVLISFTAVWSIGNVVNNYAQQGLPVVFSWLLVMLLYFVPYTMAVGQLGSTFKGEDGGISAWMRATATPWLAYLAAWIFWVINIPYIAQKPQTIMIALSWLFRGNGDFLFEISTTTISLLSLVIFLFFLWLSSKGVSTINIIGSLAGTSMFIMSILFIIITIAAPSLTGAPIETSGMTQLSTYIPTFDVGYFSTLSMMTFAVAGVENIAPYVKETKNSEREFPLAMTVMTGMVMISAVFGSIAMGILFDATNIPSDLMANGAYEAFKRLGAFYGVGNLFVILYAIANLLSQSAALVLTIDAPLKVLLANADRDFIPDRLAKKNKNGTLVNGYLMTGILVSLVTILPLLGIKNMNEIFNWLMNLNSILTPLPGLFVFLAYMLISKHPEKFHSDFKFIKNPNIAFSVGLWCFIFSAFAGVMGILPKINMQADPKAWFFQLALNIVTPLVLLGLGLILPAIAKRTNR